MRAWWALLLIGCGRIGFDNASSSVTGDGSLRDTTSTADAAPCTGTAQQLAIDSGATPEGSWVNQFKVTPMTNGFAVSYVAPDLVPFLLTYSTAGVPVKTDTALTPNKIGIEPLGVNTRILVTIVDDTGTAMWTYNNQVAGSTGPIMRGGRAPITRALAASGGTFAYVDFGNTSQIDARNITNGGDDIAPPHSIIAAGEIAASTVIAPAPAGYVVTWVATAATPHVVRAELLDASAQPMVARDIGNVLNTTAIETTPRVAAGAGQFLFAWDEVHNADSEVWVQFADATLAPIGQPLLVGHGGGPKVASDGASFWVVWPNASSTLSGSHVTTDHVARAFDIPSSGGMAVDFDLLELAGSVDVVWFERSGTGHPLWLVPACTL